MTPTDNIYTCITVHATITVPLSHPSFNTFGLRSESLNIVLTPSLDLSTSTLSISALSGNIVAEKAYGVDPNRTVVVVESGDISGDFALFDLVHLETKSGSIGVGVTPQESDTLQGVFEASTMSGDIRAVFPGEGLPGGRTYESRVGTMSGSISGVYLLGSHLSLTTLSGGVRVGVMPTGEEAATLVTDTKQGSTEVVFRGELGAGARGLDARLGSVSGAVEVEVAADWEGVVTGKSLSGEVEIGGRGVVLVEDERRWPVGRWVKGVKGAGEEGGRIEVETLNGGVGIRVGGRGHGRHGWN